MPGQFVISTPGGESRTTKDHKWSLNSVLHLPTESSKIGETRVLRNGRKDLR